MRLKRPIAIHNALPVHFTLENITQIKKYLYLCNTTQFKLWAVELVCRVTAVVVSVAKERARNAALVAAAQLGRAARAAAAARLVAAVRAVDQTIAKPRRWYALPVRAGELLFGTLWKLTK